MKFLCDNCKAKYQIADDKVAGKTVRMKCRKCGHQIEVRAAVTETSVASSPPQAPRPAARGGLATSLSAQKPKQPSQPHGGALAGAFTRQVAEPAPAGAGHDLSVSDEWYVAINGVPVGPVRVSELRRKAAAGAVNEDSLCWQEGLEEWRPIRSVPELAMLVREAMQGNRPSLSSAEPPQRFTPSAPAAPTPPRAPSRPPMAPSAPLAPRASQPPAEPMRPAPPARSNVVPFAARGSAPSAPATPAAPAALIEEIAPATAPLGGGMAAARAPHFAPSPSNFAAAPAPDPFAFNPLVPSPQAPPAQQPSIAPAMDPFAVPTPPPAPVIAPLSTSPSIPPGYMQAPPERRGVPLWFWPILLLALGFGGTVAFLVFRPPATPQPVVIQMPPTATATATNTGDVPPPPPSAETAPAPPDSTTPKKVATGPRTSPQPASTGKAADISGLLGNGGSGPAVNGNSGPSNSGGGSFDQAAVERVVANHRAGVKRTCWERVSGPDQKSSVNVTVNATVAPNGSVSSTSSSGDDPVVAKCIENQVRSWQFPAPGESKQIQLPFKFVRQ